MQEFSPAGAFITTFGSVGSGAGQLQSPRGIAVSASGQILVADTGNNRVEQWAPGSPPTYTTAVSSYENPEAFSGPNAVAVDPSGDIFIADSGHDRIVELNSERKFLRQWGEAGSGEGQFSGIGGVAVNSSGDLYVSDFGNSRIQEFGPAGEHLRTFGGAVYPASGPLSNPGAIAIDSSGNVWVLNAYGSPEGGALPSPRPPGPNMKLGIHRLDRRKDRHLPFGLAISSREPEHLRIRQLEGAGARRLGAYPLALSTFKGSGPADQRGHGHRHRSLEGKSVCL